MAESGFISLELSRSQAPVTISKTAILFAEADNDTQVNSSTLRWWYHSYRKWCF